MVADLGAVTLSKHLPSYVKFHLTSCQFAFHYGFASETRAHVFMRNACERLHIGGHFVLTTVDADVLVNRVRETYQQNGTFSCGNSKYNVVFKTLEDNFDEVMWGQQYTFHLEDAIDDVDEYLVYPGQLKALAEQHGMKLVLHLNFLDFFNAERSNNQHAVKLLGKFKVWDYHRKDWNMDKEDWEIAQVYCCYAFEKVKNVDYGDGSSSSSSSTSSSSSGSFGGSEDTQFKLWKIDLSTYPTEDEIELLEPDIDA
eukprot:TRINITY_DN2332_c1_g1_i5.p1 TRINITY_DN2332_c1_g1~~TRINITY_DN2332_c1_g1_i5.p1  ORF type:complete len:255 (+),score=79.48 TRINITY_DN2332_c1_g1_i5:705-1469(+)